MSQNHRQTNDPEQLKRVIERVFVPAGTIFLRDRNGDTPSRILRYTFPVMEIQKPPGDAARLRLLTVEHRDHRLMIECGVLKSNENTEMIKPLRLHIRTKERAEARLKFDHTARANEPYITGTLPVDGVPTSLASMDAKRDSVLRVYALALKERFDQETMVKVHLRKSNRLDHRMRPMNNLRKPIFAPNRFEEEGWHREGMHEFVPFSEYRKIRTYEDIPRTYTSEISEPLWFRDRYLYGYLQVIHREMLTIEQYEMVEKLARKLEEDLLGYDCLPKNPLRCVVEDISHHGIGFLYPRGAPFFKSLMPGEDIFFDLHLPGQDDALRLQGVIQNVKNLTDNYRFGVEIERMTPEESAAIDKYLIEAEGRKNEDA